MNKIQKIKYFNKKKSRMIKMKKIKLKKMKK